MQMATQRFQKIYQHQHPQQLQCNREQVLRCYLAVARLLRHTGQGAEAAKCFHPVRHCLWNACLQPDRQQRS